MPAIQPQILVDALLDAVQRSGWSGILISDERGQPKKMVLSSPDGEELSLWIYIWTLTHGGRPTLPDEYRIQMTSVTSPLAMNPEGLTALMGYEPNIRTFAGFDLSRHESFTTGSPSVQIDIHTLRQALTDGLAFNRKSNDEIAVGVRPDYFIGYLQNAASLHANAADTSLIGVVSKIASQQAITPEEINTLLGERQRIAQTVQRLVRSGSFRNAVLQAYQSRCAVTGIQLKLVEAAHILPVKAPGSNDSVTNGLALSPTYHRAYDAGLIYLGTDLKMKVNEEKKRILESLGLNGGIGDFMAPLNKIVILPSVVAQRPDLRMIERANEYRRISS